MDLSKIYDPYALGARVKPAFLLFLPVAVYVIATIEASRTLGGVLVTLLVSFGVVAFAANQMSTQGNKLQEKLFKMWGGAPTTIVLRHSDETVERPTKTRYMKRLAGLINDFSVITEADEQADPKAADESYRSATNYLRERTRDSKKYSLIFTENVNYGFARNLTACKKFGIVLTLICLALCVLSLYLALGVPLSDLTFTELGKHPHLLAALAIEALILVVWVCFVNHEWVRVRGFAYAKRLFESCEEVS